MTESNARLIHSHGALAQRSFMMTSSFSPPIVIFVVFIFAVANPSVKTVKFYTMQKFPAI